MSVSRPMRLTLATLTLSVVLACGGNAALERARKTGQTARQRPGASQVVDFLVAVRRAHQENAFAENPAEGERLTAEALALADQTVERDPAQAPEILGYKGVLLVEVDRPKEGWEAFHASMALAPNWVAASNIVIVYGAGARPDKVAETCASSAVAIGRRNGAGELYDFIGLCRDNMNALDENASLSWASQELKDFYFAERSRRADETARIVAAEQAQRAEENRIVREVEICSSECNQQAHLCQADCLGDVDCKNHCIDANNACVDACAARGKQELGTDPAFD